jgi:integral membrane sensor domain MASE1
LAFETGSVTAVWPPTGIALAAVLLWGYRVWPGVALGAFLANSWTGVPVYAVALISTGNTLEALGGAYLLRRLADFRPSLERVRDVLALVGLAGVVSTMISATIGVGALLAASQISADEIGSVWRTWWLGDLGGDLVVAPVLLVAATHWPFRRAPGRLLEAVAFVAALVAVSLLVFSTSTPLIYLIFPLVIWAGLRFWQPGAAATSVIVAAIAIPFTESDMGPFAGHPPDERLLFAQTFVGVVGLTALVLAAVITERRQVEDTVEYIADTLQERACCHRSSLRSQAWTLRWPFAPPGSGTWWEATSTTCSRPTTGHGPSWWATCVARARPRPPSPGSRATRCERPRFRPAGRAGCWSCSTTPSDGSAPTSSALSRSPVSSQTAPMARAPSSRARVTRCR